MASSNLSQVAFKHALKNASEHGKASVGAVTGRVIGELPQAKSDMKLTMKAISEAVSEANSLSKQQIEEKLKQFVFEEKKPQQEKEWLLPGAEKGKVVTRFLPEPNGYPHLGHAKSAWLSRTIADQWEGKCLLRFDDTNPEAESKEFVEAIARDLQWLGLKFDGKPLYSSDFIPQLYALVLQLFDKRKGFVCTCNQQTIASNRENKKECACRAKSAKQNKIDWQLMLDGKMAAGTAIVRFAGDMKSDNTVMRDPTLFRIIEAPHFRQGTKYRVWPTYDFSQVLDSLSGVTHALRSKEYELRDELYYSLLDSLGLRKPFVYGFSRLNIKGNALSKRVIKPLVLGGGLLGWDDPRLLTIAGLRRRGLLPTAIKQFVLSFGLSKVESQPTIEKLLVENRKMLDSIAQRRFFVDNPVALEVSGQPASLSHATAHNHPTDKTKGTREISAPGSYFICASDASALGKGDVFRLKDSCNVKIASKTPKKISGEYAGTELLEGKKVQWAPDKKGEFLACKLLVPGNLLNEQGEFDKESMHSREGYCEKSCEKLALGEVIQFERVGFCRLDAKNKEGMVFVLSC